MRHLNNQRARQVSAVGAASVQRTATLDNLKSAAFVDKRLGDYSEKKCKGRCISAYNI